MELIYRDKKRKILVFRSDVNTIYKKMLVCHLLSRIKGIYHVNIDLDDWENILRIDCDTAILSDKIEGQMIAFGFECSELK